MFEGLPPAALARRWSAPRVTVLERCTSSLDVAHEQAAAGAPAGTVVIAIEQTAGRGRDGRVWHSPAGGVWLAMVLRPAGAELAATSIRAGLIVADVVDEMVGRPVARVKWPNDVLCDDRKLAGVLCEGRWQGEALQWLAIGVGINVTNAPPATMRGAAIALHELLPGVRALDVLDRVVTPLSYLGTRTARLSESERAAFGARDWLHGRTLRAPVAGRGAGLADDGALLVAAADGAVPRSVREGHVELA